ncbi:unnamed protein product [Diamesa serratosioi]
MKSEIPSKVEFAVQIKNKECLEELKKVLKGSGIVEIDVNEGRVIVNTTRPWIEIQKSIEGTGRKAVLTGFSDQAAVVSLESEKYKGVIRFCSIVSNQPGIVVDGVVDGLENNKEYKLNICEFGDIRSGCDNLGDIYKNSSYKINSDDTGRSTFRTVDHNLHVWELIGRSVSISEPIGTRLTCGVICRAAAIFQNYKKICACDGTTIWNEKAGKAI